MAETALIRYCDNGKTLERFTPESQISVSAVPKTVENIADEEFTDVKT